MPTIVFSLMMFLNGVMLGYFVFRRWQEFKKDSLNFVNFLYLLGSGLCAIAFFAYGITYMLIGTPKAAAMVAVIATIINVAGYSYFFRVPAYLKLSPKKYSVFSHILTLYVLIIAVQIILNPPVLIWQEGILWWSFSALQSRMIVFVNGPAFLLNVILIYNSIKASEESRLIKFMTLIAAFGLGGWSGGYLYSGQNPSLIWVAYLCMVIAIMTLVLGTFFVSLERKKQLS